MSLYNKLLNKVVKLAKAMEKLYQKSIWFVLLFIVIDFAGIWCGCEFIPNETISVILCALWHMFFVTVIGASLIHYNIHKEKSKDE